MSVKRIWEGWKRIATVIGEFQSRAILSVFYFVIVLPFGLGVRLFTDPLAIRGRRQTGWMDFTDRARTVEEASRQS
jgi:hypothetical protein